MESEASLPPFGPTFWNLLVGSLGCATSSEELSCMRAIPGQTIRDTVANNSFIFTPAPNQYYLEDAGPALFSPSAAHVPVLLGSNKDEGRAFAYSAGLDNPLANVTAVLSTYLPSALVSIILAAAPIGQLPYDAVSYALTNVAFLCSISELGAQLAGSGYSGMLTHKSAY